MSAKGIVMQHELFTLFLTPDAGLIMASIIMVMTMIIKPVVVYCLNGNRRRPWVKQRLLPSIAILIGSAMALWMSPELPVLTTTVSKLLYGAVIGFISTYIYRAFLSRLLGKVDTALEEKTKTLPPPSWGSE